MQKLFHAAEYYRSFDVVFVLEALIDEYCGFYKTVIYFVCPTDCQRVEAETI